MDPLLVFLCKMYRIGSNSVLWLWCDGFLGFYFFKMYAAEA